jgi:division/cell wall cluster transcriptional repressor MraZ
MNLDAQSLFAGTFERSMDAKKRVAVPSAWLAKKEGEEFFSVPRPDGKYLVVMPPEEFRRQEALFMANEKRTMAERRDAVRAFYASAFQLITDGQGRVLLNDKHCEMAGLKGTVAFVGGRSRFEIWDKDRFKEFSEGAVGNYLAAAEEIGL